VNFRRQRLEEVSINLTPLIDVVFLLLIFFMVTTTFTRETHLQLELPTSTSEKPLAANDQVEVLIDAQGNFEINGETLVKSDLDTLRRALEGLTGDNKDIPIVVIGDAKAPHQAVIFVLDAVGQLGLTKVRMATRPAEQG